MGKLKKLRRSCAEEPRLKSYHYHCHLLWGLYGIKSVLFSIPLCLNSLVFQGLAIVFQDSDHRCHSGDGQKRKQAGKWKPHSPMLFSIYGRKLRHFPGHRNQQKHTHSQLQITYPAKGKEPSKTGKLKSLMSSLQNNQSSRLQ